MLLLIRPVVWSGPYKLLPRYNYDVFTPNKVGSLVRFTLLTKSIQVHASYLFTCFFTNFFSYFFLVFLARVWNFTFHCHFPGLTFFLSLRFQSFLGFIWFLLSSGCHKKKEENTKQEKTQVYAVLFFFPWPFVGWPSFLLSRLVLFMLSAFLTHSPTSPHTHLHPCRIWRRKNKEKVPVNRSWFVFSIRILIAASFGNYKFLHPRAKASAKPSTWGTLPKTSSTLRETLYILSGNYY